MCDTCLPRGLTRRTTLAMFGAAVASPILGMSGVQPRSAVPPSEVAPGLSINPRDSWAADLPPLWQMAPEDVRFLLVHHTAGPNSYEQASVRQQLRDVYRFHTSSAKNWPDVCYNFFVDRYGGVWEGRAGSLAGPVVADATGGSQGFAQLVCLLGDFTSQLPTPEAVDSTIRTLAWLADRSAIDTSPGASVTFASRGSNRWPAGAEVVAATISGHRDMSATACPGDLLYPVVSNEFQAEVTNRRGQIPSTVNTSTTLVVTAVPTTSMAATAPSTVAPSATAPSTTANVPATSVEATPTTLASSSSSTGLTSAVAAPPTSGRSPTVPPRPAATSADGGANPVLPVVAVATITAMVVAVTRSRRGYIEPPEQTDERP